MTTHDVDLGFEVGTGAPVRIPMHHTVITGMTQRAGKTTALEALITRSGAKALTFVTKRGEGAFTNARRTDPYFSERADWQYVAGILEASRGEKLKFERAWIIRASRGARTLADVQRNVRKAMEKATGMSADVYLTLDAYLDVVVPQIARVDWAPAVELKPGVNAMDLTDLAVEMQHLVIRSSLDWVLEKESGTVVVVPEAWKFIPQGRGTPVKLAAESYIRQGAGLHNYLWLDSQDIAGVEKAILKNVAVWVLGVQRESNEIKRTLDQIPAGIKKPKPEQVATLGLGEFFACWDSHTIKTYVQPAWMSEQQAQAIATGKARASDFAGLRRASTIAKPNETKPTARRPEKPPTKENDEVTEQDIARLEKCIETAVASAIGRDTQAKVNVTDRPAPKGPRTTDESHTLSEDQWEAIYQRFKDRLVKEAPALVRVLATQTELEIKTERRTVEADQGTWLGAVATLIHDGFLDKPTKTNDVWREVQRRYGMGGISARASEALDKLHGMQLLTKEAEGFQAAPGAKKRVTTK